MVLCVNGTENLKTGKPTFMMKRDKDASLTQQKILFNKFLATSGAVKMSDHPPYSPDIATSDFHFFLELKNWLEGQSFQKRKSFKASLKPISHHWRQGASKRGLGNLVY
ncbi:hypothetical protein AVEN_249897-1 [Araneus ventricosus]|uniref:Histone-lysine N-methyltransferase SETMAR n=1 Tax=Araneus ventricosus TaxID=182803 RepID=A0A4Y2J3H7_ARAVE|nr:hypothetical protein AVEN_249897-1 [Araneus ventricosus]